mmetsp:Transcript_19708/g.40185  ORF Transcript_19708/g.40185 Transcript_19708/m.40185 type:complete len:259 (-) Transcript_19708:1725-2501(-)
MERRSSMLTPLLASAITGSARRVWLGFSDRRRRHSTPSMTGRLGSMTTASKTEGLSLSSFKHCAPSPTTSTVHLFFFSSELMIFCVTDDLSATSTCGWRCSSAIRPTGGASELPAAASSDCPECGEESLGAGACDSPLSVLTVWFCTTSSAIGLLLTSVHAMSRSISSSSPRESPSNLSCMAALLTLDGVRPNAMVSQLTIGTVKVKMFSAPSIPGSLGTWMQWSVPPRHCTRLNETYMPRLFKLLSLLRSDENFWLT